MTLPRERLRRLCTALRLRRRKGPGKAPCETPTELLDGVASPAKLDFPVLGLTTRSSEIRARFKRQHFGRVRHLALALSVLAACGTVARATITVRPPASDPGEYDQAPAGIYGLDSDSTNDTVSDDDHGGTASAHATTHKVRKGDTLWDLSRAYFQDPWRWPKVWALNPEIANPHWIFPGQIIRLRVPDATVPLGETSRESRPRLSQPASFSVAPPPHGPSDLPPDVENLHQLGFVDEDSLRAAGTINGSLEEKILLATGDHAYVEFPPGKPPKGGARYAVYQVDTDHPLREPQSKLVLGYLVHVYGEVIIDSLTDRAVANARLIALSEPVERGYRVGPLFRQLRALKSRHNLADMTARIVGAVEPNLLIANQMFVVLNRGRRHGVEVGNRFLVLRQGDGIKRVMEDWDATDHRFPPHAIAEILAVDVQNETTIGWISRGTRELHLGDLADLRRGY